MNAVPGTFHEGKGAGGSAVLAECLLELREGSRADTDHHGELVEELLSLVSRQAQASRPSELADVLLGAATSNGDRRQAVADIVGSIARRLAPQDEPPTEVDDAAAWQALVTAADRLYGSGVAPLGRVSFVSDRLLEIMVEEARACLAEPSPEASRSSVPGGRALSGLAVSRKLQDAVAAALGIPVSPGYQALYAFDPPESHVRTHLDSREYELIFHMVLDHELPSDGSPGSALVVHLPGRPDPLRTWLRPGEGVVLCGRGTIHSWERLREDERRLLVDIAWVRARGQPAEGAG